jgi:hypothetical protein
MTICCWVGSLNSLNPSNFNLQYLAILYSIWWLIVTVIHMWPFSSQWFGSNLPRWQFYAISIQNLLEQLDILLTKKWGIFAIGSTKGPKFKRIMLAYTKCIRGAHCKLRPRWLGAFFLNLWTKFCQNEKLKLKFWKGSDFGGF